MGTVRVSLSALTPDLGLEALPLSFVVLAATLRVVEGDAVLSVDTAVAVREMRLVCCSSLEPDFDLDGVPCDGCRLRFDAGLSLELGRCARDAEAGVEGFAGDPCSPKVLGTVTVTKVSTSRDRRTFSSVFCVWLRHWVDVGTTAFPEIDEDIDSVRGRLALEAVPVPESGGWLPDLTLAEDSRLLTRETVRFLALKSGGLAEPTAHESSLV